MDRGKLIPPLVGTTEAAEMLQWSRGKVAVYVQRGKFPEPIQRLKGGPVWTRQQIEEYRERMGRREKH